MGKLSSPTDQLAGMNSTTTEPVPTVMIVEDAPEFVQLVEASLTRDGSYRIEVATNGLDAIDLSPEKSNPTSSSWTSGFPASTASRSVARSERSAMPTS